jgi:hypothetical protein
MLAPARALLTVLWGGVMKNRATVRLIWYSLLMLLLAGLAMAAAQEKWLPITAEEKALTSCPQQPGAPAVYLYREEVTRDDDLSVSIFSRLKVLTPAGKEYANLEIPVVRGAYKIKNLKARVIEPDGSFHEFTGEVLEKTVLRSGRTRVTVKTIALPNVDVGSIIEYSCRFEFDAGKASSSDSQDALDNLAGRRTTVEEGGVPPVKEILSLASCAWAIQARLFTYKAHFVYFPFNKGQIFVFRRNMRLAWASHGLPGGPPELSGDRVELDLKDIPAYEEEELMAPEDAGRMGVDFFFLGSSIGSADEYWKREAAIWRQGAEVFMAGSPEATAESKRLLSGMSDPLAQLKKLYERTQQVRNLSYDRTMTRQQKKAQGIKPNRSAAEVLKHDYGVRSDITRTFSAMARAAGFSADVARVATRDDKFFHENLISLYQQFDSEIAVVKAGGREWLLDPATPFCPFGTVRWACSDTIYIRTSGSAPVFITSPVSLPDEALTSRLLFLQLDSEGNLSGLVKVVFRGQEALARRLEHLDDDEVTAKKGLGEELTALLPAGSRVALQKAENMKNSEEEIRAEFAISIPGFATAAGGRLLLPVYPMKGTQRYPFQHARRVHPVYFPYPYRETDDIIITLPAGMAVESVPAARQHKRMFSEHALNCAVEADGKLHVRQDLTIKKSLIPIEQYPALKSFFDQVRESDEGQVVLSLPTKK